MLQSLAGGTGAGLGTYIAEAIRDNFPSSFLLNHCIWYTSQTANAIYIARIMHTAL